jgi:hypothetical protein
MTYWGIINYEKLMEWKLGKTTVLLMPLFADLESWATRVKTDEDSDEVYYLLFREKILEELPFLGSISSISRAIKELEDKGIIKCIHKNSTPAYCLTQKGLSWKRKPKTSEETNGAEPKKTKARIAKEKHPLFLAKKTKAKDLTETFIKNLQTYCHAYAEKTKIPKFQFEAFMDDRASKGVAYEDWASAFRTWCRKYSEYRLMEENKNGQYK